MFYNGIFTRPAGMIYDCLEPTHWVPRFTIPDDWQRYLGIDFGGVNTAAVFMAQNPESGKVYAYREYKAGGKTMRGHVADLLAGEPMYPIAYGGAGSEQQWRDEFGQAGLGVSEPSVKEVDVGIGRIYGALKRGELFFFDDLRGVRDDHEGYQRETDENGEPTEKIMNKEQYHFCDAVRYIGTALFFDASGDLAWLD